ncbi:MAG: thiamine pyrophosphate-dependent dehydrogenase E1 component subunit alpha [Spirochaetota bacterium]
MTKVLPREDDGDGKCFEDLEIPVDLDLGRQKDMYLKMCLIREFDTKVKELWLDNKIYGLAHSYVGAEAIAVGACAALRPDDYITSTHRGHGHTIAKGADINKMMAELFGKYEGYNRGKGGSMHIADVEHGMLGATGIVGSGMPIALGSALSANVLGNGKITICFHGDGGTNQGVWHETINMAAAWNLPVVFIIENNQMAIGTELSCVSKETDLFRRALGYGIPGVLVDGFNVFEVYLSVKEAVERARAGQGPTLIEARFLRLLGHFVADDQWYRDLTKVEPYWDYDPVKRMREYFILNKLLKEKEIMEIEAKAKASVERSVVYASTECSEPGIDTLYEDIYAHGEVIV